MQSIRGSEAAMIFQDARSALNPVLPVGEQIGDIHRFRSKATRREGLDKAAELMAATGIPRAASRVKSYPHELSGGMCQRVLIAMALASRPKLLLADEITSGLDVTIQAQVLGLLEHVVADLEATLVLVSHDLAVVSAACTDVAVMYGGLVLEQGDVHRVLEKPMSPYSRALVRCFQEQSGERMPFIPGTAHQTHLVKGRVSGCPFAPRCDVAKDVCRHDVPVLRELEPGHVVACHEAEA
jgi:oligopeptide/dipeptide ABC transporter ATP-binding protein